MFQGSMSKDYKIDLTICRSCNMFRHCCIRDGSLDTNIMETLCSCVSSIGVQLAKVQFHRVDKFKDTNCLNYWGAKYISHPQIK